MRVRRVDTFQELEELSPGWNTLARGVPFRTWQWLQHWWQAYGAGHRLYVLAVETDQGQLVALAPWYLETTMHKGRTLKFLGSGEVCTDYQSVLVQPRSEPEAATVLAEWLIASHEQPEHRWDFLELADVFSADTAVERLVFQLQESGCQVARRAGPQCWRVELPCSWNEYVARFNKPRRKWMRRLERRLWGDASLRIWRPNGAGEFYDAYRHLVRLHQRRWESLGAPGCFASERFSEFTEHAFHGLWREGRLHLTCLERSGATIGVQADLVGDATVFSYQAGVDPQQLSHEPGHVLHAYTIHNAIEAGLEAFDFLRGNEPYKAIWQATPRQCSYIRIASPQSVSQLRHQAWLAGTAMKDWIKDGLSWAGLTPCVGDSI